ncbi:hypothetical protein RND81_07G023100 [Saponaria officinalis]|uniref:PB1 domain-containing protein n=1 Tax=Saponaria officinalis TaxID=3572 RepID=A0AAW1JMA5_SAPOF
MDLKGNNNGGGEETALSPTTGAEKVKFFCSHGGKILPRPSDGTLKYVGGETRAIAVPRSISFSGLMKKISDLFDGEFVLKYQIAKEDLDSLVSVKSDEDVRHMLDEYDRLEREGNSKLRTFLFPVKPVTIETHTALSGLGPHGVDQRFVDAVNGIVRPTNAPSKPLLNTGRLKSFSPSPTEGSPQSLSPRSAVPQNLSLLQENSLISSLQGRLVRVHKVQSSPNLCSLGAQQQPHRNICPVTPPQYFYYGCQMPGVASDHHIYTQHGYQSPTNIQDHMHPRSEYSRGPPGEQVGYYYAMSRGYKGSGGHRRWGHLEQHASPPGGSYSRSPGDPWY